MYMSSSFSLLKGVQFASLTVATASLCVSGGNVTRIFLKTMKCLGLFVTVSLRLSLAHRQRPSEFASLSALDACHAQLLRLREQLSQTPRPEAEICEFHHTRTEIAIQSSKYDDLCRRLDSLLSHSRLSEDEQSEETEAPLRRLTEERQRCFSTIEGLKTREAELSLRLARAEAVASPLMNKIYSLESKIAILGHADHYKSYGPSRVWEENRKLYNEAVKAFFCASLFLTVAYGAQQRLSK